MPRTCTEPGCDRRHHARGRCSTHYYVWLRTLTGEERIRLRTERSPARPGNPWYGQQSCPACSDADTLPWDSDRKPGQWHCVACHADFRLETVR